MKDADCSIGLGDDRGRVVPQDETSTFNNLAVEIRIFWLDSCRHRYKVEIRNEHNFLMSVDILGQLYDHFEYFSFIRLIWSS